MEPKTTKPKTSSVSLACEDPDLDLSYLGAIPVVRPDGSTYWRKPQPEDVALLPALCRRAHRMGSLAGHKAVIHLQLLQANRRRSALEQACGQDLDPEPVGTWDLSDDPADRRDA